MGLIPSAQLKLFIAKKEQMEFTEERINYTKEAISTEMEALFGECNNIKTGNKAENHIAKDANKTKALDYKEAYAKIEQELKAVEKEITITNKKLKQNPNSKQSKEKLKDLNKTKEELIKHKKQITKQQQALEQQLQKAENADNDIKQKLYNAEAQRQAVQVELEAMENIIQKNIKDSFFF